MQTSQAKIFFGIIGILILGVIATVLIRSSSTPAGPGKYDTFTQCLKDKGAVFYGTFWCKYCQAQKKMFDSSQKLLPYIECSSANGQSQLQVCVDKKIEGYPTWEFIDGSRLTGAIPLQQLADKTSCLLPE